MSARTRLGKICATIGTLNFVCLVYASEALRVPLFNFGKCAIHFKTQFEDSLHIKDLLEAMIHLHLSLPTLSGNQTMESSPLNLITIHDSQHFFTRGSSGNSDLADFYLERRHAQMFFMEYCNIHVLVDSHNLTASAYNFKRKTYLRTVFVEMFLREESSIVFVNSGSAPYLQTNLNKFPLIFWFYFRTFRMFVLNLHLRQNDIGHSHLNIKATTWYLICLPCISNHFKQLLAPKDVKSTSILQLRDQWIVPVVYYSIHKTRYINVHCSFPPSDWTECKVTTLYFATFFDMLNVSIKGYRNDNKFLHRVIGHLHCCSSFKRNTFSDVTYRPTLLSLFSTERVTIAYCQLILGKSFLNKMFGWFSAYQQNVWIYFSALLIFLLIQHSFHQNLKQDPQKSIRKNIIIFLEDAASAMFSIIKMTLRQPHEENLVLFCLFEMFMLLFLCLYEIIALSSLIVPSVPAAFTNMTSLSKSSYTVLYSGQDEMIYDFSGRSPLLGFLEVGGRKHVIETLLVFESNKNPDLSLRQRRIKVGRYLKKYFKFMKGSLGISHSPRLIRKFLKTKEMKNAYLMDNGPEDDGFVERLQKVAGYKYLCETIKEPLTTYPMLIRFHTQIPSEFRKVFSFLHTNGISVAIRNINRYIFAKKFAEDLKAYLKALDNSTKENRTDVSESDALSPVTDFQWYILLKDLQYPLMLFSFLLIISLVVLASENVYFVTVNRRNHTFYYLCWHEISKRKLALYRIISKGRKQHLKFITQQWK